MIIILFLALFLQMFSILECNRIAGSAFFYFLNFVILFISYLSSILSLFFSKSLVKLLLYNKRFLILSQLLLFHRFFNCHRCSYGQEPIVNWFVSGYFSVTIFLFPFVLDWCSIGQLWFLDFSVFSEQLDCQKKSRFLVSICPFFHRQNLLLFW